MVVELRGFNLQFAPQTSIKSQVLADFVAEWSSFELEQVHQPEADEHWTMHFDGSFTLKGAGARVVLASPTGDLLRYIVQLYFPATNNIVEYEGILSGMRAASALRIKYLLAIGESLLVVNQV